MSRRLFALLAASALAGCAAAPTAPEHGIERLSAQDLARILPQAEPKLAPAELLRLSKEGVAPGDIIERIKASGSRYALTAAQMIELHAQGLSTQVLDYIQAAQEQALRDRLAEEINQREARHAEELRRERDSCRCYYDPWWPGYGWGHGYPYGPGGYYYWRR